MTQRIQVGAESFVVGTMTTRSHAGHGTWFTVRGEFISPFYGNEPRPCRLEGWRHPDGKLTSPSGGMTHPDIQVESGTHHGWVLHPANVEMVSATIKFPEETP